MKIKLHYYQKPNFGDALSPKLVERLSGLEVTYAHPRTADLVAVGSVLFAGGALFVERRKILTPVGLVKMGRKLLDVFMPPLHIWGSGFLCDPGVNEVIRIRKTKVCAVRGKKTLDVLMRAGIVSPTDAASVALGDPGLLYPMLLDDQHPARPGQWDVGVVPHYLDLEAGKALAKKIAAEGRSVKLIDVNNPDPLQTVADIGSCREIRSSSLHGLVVADAFGIPNEHIVFSTLGQSENEASFKFEDYYSAWRADIPQGVTVMPREVFYRIRDDLLREFPNEG